MHHKIKINKGNADDTFQMQQLFADTIKQVCNADYNEKQIQAWISGVQDKKRWENIAASQYLLVARYQKQVVGFCSLKEKNYVDMLYVHKDFQGEGIAKKLYSEIEKEALKQGQTELTADVSISARPFFERMGFTIEKEQVVIRNKIGLTNFKMIKKVQP